MLPGRHYRIGREMLHTMHMIYNIKSPKPLWLGLLKWRRRWDSNPRNAETFDSFQDCSNQPLWHSSIPLLDILISYLIKIFCQDILFVKIFFITLQFLSALLFFIMWTALFSFNLITLFI